MKIPTKPTWDDLGHAFPLSTAMSLASLIPERGLEEINGTVHI
jgi:hypothetical protein